MIPSSLTHAASRAGALLLGLALAGLAPARPLAAQDSVIVIDPDAPLGDTLTRIGPPADVLRELLLTFNDSSVTRLTGNFTLPTGSHVTARLALYRGVLRIAGTVDGPVTVINGDLIIAPGGVVQGDILVVGGRFQVQPGGRHTGRPRVYPESAPVFRTLTGGLAVRTPGRSLGDIATARASFQAGKIHTTLSLETGRTYNRVEGLPIIVGPAFTLPTTGGTEGHLDARLVIRTAGDQSSLRDEFGYVIRAEWHFPGAVRGGVGARFYSVIEPIEEQPLSRGESGLSAFILSRDYRDYYQTKGTTLYGWLEPFGKFRVDGQVRFDKHESVRSADPTRLFRNDDPWRPNPLIDDGHFTTFGARIEYDTRNNRFQPSSGWRIRADIEHGRSDDVAPVALPSEVRQPIPSFRDYRFSRFSFDARRYARFGPSTRVNLRVTGGGWLGGDPLPIQHRVALGGPDILPGFGFRTLRCAPATLVDPAQTALCDRYLAAQVEIRTRLRLGISSLVPTGDLYGLERFLSLNEVDIVAFGDAGDAWLTGTGPSRVPNNRVPNFSEWKKDIGIGLDTGTFGVYVAKSVSSDASPRFVFRLVRRF